MSHVFAIKSAKPEVTCEGSYRLPGDKIPMACMFVIYTTVGDRTVRQATRYACRRRAVSAMNETALAMVADGWEVNDTHLVKGDTSVTFQIKPTAFNALKCPNQNGLPE